MSEAFIESHAGLRVDLPNGKSVTCRTLKVADGARFYRAWVEAGRGDFKAQMMILDEFPQAVGVEEEDLTPAEVFEVLHDFLFFSRTAKSGATKGPTEATSSPSTSTT